MQSALRQGVVLRTGRAVYSKAMFIIRYRLPPGHFSEIAEARLMVAVTKAHELREAGHGEITITDDSDGLVHPLDWRSTIERD